MEKIIPKIKLDMDIINSYIQDYADYLNRSDQAPDCIIAISRGGFVPAVYLAHALNIKNIIPVFIESYIDTHESVIPTLTKKISKDDKLTIKEAKNILIVDDIIDSGNTLIFLLNELVKIKNNINNIKVFTLASKSKFINSINNSNINEYINTRQLLFEVDPKVYNWLSTNCYESLVESYEPTIYTIPYYYDIDDEYWIIFPWENEKELTFLENIKYYFQTIFSNIHMKFYKIST